MTDKPPSIRVIIEETVQRVYDLDVTNAEHERYFDTAGLRVTSQISGKPPEVLGKRAKKGGRLVEPPADVKPIAEWTVFTGFTALIMEGEKPVHQIKRTLTTITSGPVKS